jgi:alpha-galactosidase
MPRRLESPIRSSGIVAMVGLLLAAVPGFGQRLENQALSLAANQQDGSYELRTRAGRTHPLLRARVGAEVDRQWIFANEYPRHRSSQSAFNDLLGSGREVAMTCSGLDGKPDLTYRLQLYDGLPYGTIQVEVQNRTAKNVTVQAIRSVEAVDRAMVDLDGRESADRVLSDSFSEDWPNLVLYDLGRGPRQMHRGVGSQLIYNRESKQSLFLGALTSDRFLTILRLGYQGSGADAKIASYTVDSTGTTEIMKDNNLRRSPPEDQVELSLPLKAGQNLSSERLMMAAGPDYLGQLLAYGDAIRRLHHARVSSPNLIGWWSWTSYYMAINEGVSFTNAQWQAAHLKSLGYQYFHIDEGYQYARGEYTTADATKFPNGMRPLGSEVRRLGLTLGIWTAPFEVSNRAWVYEHHKDWLVHTADGKPISIGTAGGGSGPGSDALYALDATHPEAQEYLRQTYSTLVHDWGVRFIKLDFMDTSAIEGYHYRPDTTALEAQRIGLELIRKAVGDDVLLDKDGSPMLNPVGIVDAGRISNDTSHSFQNTRTVAPGIAARFYMNRNWFISDPDAYNVCENVPSPRRRQGGQARPGVTLQEAQAAIVLSAISGGMYEIGDDLPILGAEKERLALVENQDLLQVAKLSRSFTPLDLLSYEPEDELPAIYFLREDQRQSVLAVYNWTEKPRSHTLKLADLGLPAGHTFRASDVLNQGAPISLDRAEVRLLDQPPHSVKVVKLIDSTVPAAAPAIMGQVPSEASVAMPIKLSAQAEPAGVPALAYHWDFGDGTAAGGPQVTHTYTTNGDFTVRLTVEGLDGLPAQQSFPVKVTGTIPQPSVSQNRRYVEPPDR